MFDPSSGPAPAARAQHEALTLAGYLAPFEPAARLRKQKLKGGSEERAGFEVTTE